MPPPPFTGLQANTTSSVQFSCSVVSDSLWPRELSHARPPCPSPTPGVYPNSCPLSRWCHPTISSSVIPFYSFPQSFPSSGSFQMSQLSTSGGQSIVFSAFNPWVRKIFWRRKWGTLYSILAWKIPRTEGSGGGYTSWGHKELNMTEWLTLSLSWIPRDCRILTTIL